MTPKEKAKELVDKFRGMNCEEIQDDEALILYTICGHLAKQCALILCDEIIEETNKYAFDQEIYHGVNPVANYFEQVKNEIEKL